jgi:hypothetical protein
MLEHAIWFRKRWRPGEDDWLANEALYLIEQLAIMLEDCENDVRATRQVMRAAVAFSHEQTKEIARLRARGTFRRNEPRREPMDPAYLREVQAWLTERRRHERREEQPA